MYLTTHLCVHPSFVFRACVCMLAPAVFFFFFLPLTRLSFHPSIPSIDPSCIHPHLLSSSSSSVVAVCRRLLSSVLNKHNSQPTHTCAAGPLLPCCLPVLPIAPCSSSPSLTHSRYAFIHTRGTRGEIPLTNTLVSQSHPLMVCSVTVSTQPWFALSQSHPLMVCSVTVSGPWPLLLILWYHSLTTYGMLCHSLRPMPPLTNTLVSQSHPLMECSVTVSGLWPSY